MPSTFKYLITVLLALGFICNGLAQQASLDSLARDLSDLVFDYDPRAEQWVDSLQEQGIGREHKALQHTIGNYYYLNGIYDSALVSYKRALKLAEEEGDSARVLSLTNNVGVALIELGRLSEAVAYLRAVLEIRKGTSDTNRILSSYGNLIEAYQVLEAREKVWDLLQESFALGVDSAAQAEALRRLHLLAYFHHYKYQEYEAALPHLAAMKRLGAYLSDQRIAPEYELGMGRVKIALGEEEEGVRYLKLAAQEFENLGFEGGSSATYRELGDYYLKQDLRQAEQYYQRALAQVTAPDIRMSILGGLLTVYKSTEQYQRALAVTEEMNLLKDSLQGLAVQKAVFEIESQYELQEKESEITRLENEATIAELEKKRLNTYLWGAAVLAVVVILILLSLYRNTQLKRSQEALKADLVKQQNEAEKQSLQIQLFRTQINPHFFFNALNSIQSYVLDSKPLDSSRYLGRFARLMRSVLELNREEFIPLEKELEVLEDYLSIEQLRFEGKFTYRVDCPAELAQVSIPTMAMQPFLENAILHGFEDMEEGGEIEIRVQSEGSETLIISISDNGKGYQPAEKSPEPYRRSMALSLIEQRFSVLSEESGQEYSYQIRNRAPQAQGTEVLIKIPFA